MIRLYKNFQRYSVSLVKLPCKIFTTPKQRIFFLCKYAFTLEKSEGIIFTLNTTDAWVLAVSKGVHDRNYPLIFYYTKKEKMTVLVIITRKPTLFMNFTNLCVCRGIFCQFFNKKTRKVNNQSIDIIVAKYREFDYSYVTLIAT